MTSAWPPGDTFRGRYESAIKSLLGKPPADRGLSEANILNAENRLGIRLPAALRDYYLAAGNLSQLNEAHNRLLAPDDWFLDADHLVFLEENQRVVFWGVAASTSLAEDAAVYQGGNQLPGSIEWYPSEERCCEFLLVMLHHQAVWGGFDWLATADIGE